MAQALAIDQVIIATMSLQIGDQFDRYQIRASMAQGGMGSLYRAVDMTTGQEVAIKITDPTMIGDPAQYERFQRELEVMKTLRHPAIQHGLASAQFNRTPFLVTELVDGQSTRQWVQEHVPLPPNEAVRLIGKFADAIAFCHEHNVIHRDLKPENILITAGGEPVIIDFGLALTKNAHRITYSNLSNVAGTPEYMPPEQVDGQRGDQRTDLYALGIMFYELLTGQPPFTGDSPLAIMAQHTQAPIPRLDGVRPGISPQLATSVARCLQRNPDDRYPDLRAFIAALDHPETADLSILDQDTGAASVVPFWRTQTATMVATIVLVILAVVVLAFATQALRAR
jgi:serine/threonine protein kinase